LDWWGASRILDCAGRFDRLKALSLSKGKAERRRRFSRALTFSQKKSGVALRFPPHSKRRGLIASGETVVARVSHALFLGVFIAAGTAATTVRLHAAL